VLPRSQRLWVLSSLDKQLMRQGTTLLHPWPQQQRLLFFNKAASTFTLAIPGGGGNYPPRPWWTVLICTPELMMPIAAPRWIDQPNNASTGGLRVKWHTNGLVVSARHTSKFYLIYLVQSILLWLPRINYTYISLTH
jgi:hypothetical protein